MSESLPALRTDDPMHTGWCSISACSAVLSPRGPGTTGSAPERGKHAVARMTGATRNSRDPHHREEVCSERAVRVGIMRTGTLRVAGRHYELRRTEPYDSSGPVRAGGCPDLDDGRHASGVRRRGRH